MLARPGGHEAIHPVNGAPQLRRSLRNAAINYRNGWFFVTCQVARNKSIFGAITGESCELNPFWRQVEAYWRALLISPQLPESRLNKKVAAWCNEYVLRHADEIWAGDLSPNGMLSAMLKSLRRI